MEIIRIIKIFFVPIAGPFCKVRCGQSLFRHFYKNLKKKQNEFPILIGLACIYLVIGRCVTDVKMDVTSSWNDLEHAKEVECNLVSVVPSVLKFSEFLQGKKNKDIFLVNAVDRRGNDVHSFLKFDEKKLQFMALKGAVSWRKGRSLGLLEGYQGSFFSMKSLENRSGIHLTDLKGLVKETIFFPKTMTVKSIRFIEKTAHSGWILVTEKYGDRVSILFWSRGSKVKVVARTEISDQYIAGKYNDSIVFIHLDQSRDKDTLVFDRYSDVSKISSRGFNLPSSIERWVGVIDNNNLEIVFVEGDSLVGEAHMRFLKIKIVGERLNVLDNHTVSLGDNHAGQPYLIPYLENKNMLLMRSWRDSEATVYQFLFDKKLGVNKTPMGIFPQDMFMMGGFVGKKYAIYSMFKQRKAIGDETSICRLGVL